MFIIVLFNIFHKKNFQAPVYLDQLFYSAERVKGEKLYFMVITKTVLLL
jgi:hypothetical protein